MSRNGTKYLAWSVAVVSMMALPAAPGLAQQEFTLTSPAFEHHGAIPLGNSAYGDNVSPALAWTGAPEGTLSFALVLDDPDVPGNAPFVHWVIYNIPADATGLPEGIPTDAAVSDPAGAHQGVTGLRRTGYFGPRPPAGPAHSYNFQLYALSTEPNIPDGLNRGELMEAIEPHILAETTLTGMYQAE